MGVLKIVYCMCTKAFLCVIVSLKCFNATDSACFVLFYLVFILKEIPFIWSDDQFYTFLCTSCFFFSFFFPPQYHCWSRSYIQYVQAHSVLLSLVKAPSVQHLMWGEKVLLSISKIDGKERQPGSVAAAQGESRVVRQKTTLKTICTRIPSVSKSSGERVPLDRKPY